METGGLISIASLALVGSVVGVRLLGVSIRTRQLPELVLGLSMLCTACLGQPVCAAGRLTIFAVSGYLGVALCAGLEYAVLCGAAPLLDPVPLALTAAIGFVAGGSFYLAYSPPDLYVRWIRARADRSVGLPVT